MWGGSNLDKYDFAPYNQLKPTVAAGKGVRPPSA